MDESANRDSDERNVRFGLSNVSTPTHIVPCNCINDNLIVYLTTSFSADRIKNITKKCALNGLAIPVTYIHIIGKNILELALNLSHTKGDHSLAPCWL